MTDYDRGAYTPQTDAPLAFDPRRPSERRPMPMALIGSGVVLAVLRGGGGHGLSRRRAPRGREPPPRGRAGDGGENRAAAVEPDRGRLGLDLQPGRLQRRRGRGAPAPPQTRSRPRQRPPSPSGRAAVRPSGAEPRDRGHALQALRADPHRAPAYGPPKQAATPTGPTKLAAAPTQKTPSVASKTAASSDTSEAEAKTASLTPPRHPVLRSKLDESELAAAGATGTDTSDADAPAAAKPAVHKAKPAKLAAADPIGALVTSSTTAATPAGKSVVQIGAFSSSALADKGYADVSATLPGKMGGKAKHVLPLDKDGTTLYRTWLSGFATRADAQAFCEALKAKGKTCLVKG